jgi:hypothetical protein
MVHFGVCPVGHAAHRNLRHALVARSLGLAATLLPGGAHADVDPVPGQISFQEAAMPIADERGFFDNWIWFRSVVRHQNRPCSRPDERNRVQGRTRGHILWSMFRDRQCSKLCGKDYSNIPIAFPGVSEESYAAWLAGMRKCAATDPAPGHFAANEMTRPPQSAAIASRVRGDPYCPRRQRTIMKRTPIGPRALLIIWRCSNHA